MDLGKLRDSLRFFLGRTCWEVQFLKALICDITGGFCWRWRNRLWCLNPRVTLVLVLSSGNQSFFLVKINCFPWISSLKFNFLSSIVNEFDLGERLSGNHGVYQYGVSLQFFNVTPYELLDRHIFPTCSGGIWHFIDSIQMFPSTNQAFVVSLKVG